jgi:hypothetical protein
VARSLWDTPSGRDRRWTKRREAYAPAPAYVRIVIVLLAATLVGTLAWQGIQTLRHPAAKFSPIIPPGDTKYVAREGTGAGSNALAIWESDVLGALQSAAAQGAAGNVTAGEVEVDRAASIVMSARMQGQKVSPEFYAKSLKALDEVLKTKADNSRLLEHVTQARIELADLRSAQPVSDVSTGAAANKDDAPSLNTYPGATETPLLNVGPGTQAPHAVTTPGHVVLSSPHALGGQSVLDAASIGGDYLDATLMPESSEVLLPPATRNLNDEVQVEGLTIEGASQTLDGVRWKNVTFIGARLRYEGGQISLQNVKFIRCRFGFNTDERGARLADAIALGQKSIEIQ